MITHELKIDPVPFSLLDRGVKDYELRFNDRNFKCGDLLRLVETRHSSQQMKKGAPLEYTSRVLIKRIVHVIDNDSYRGGLRAGWVILSVSDI